MLSMEEIKAGILPLLRKYEVVRVDLFGSYAEGTATESSDVDLVVEFAVPVPSIVMVMGLKEELSRKLGIPVDLVTVPLPHPERLDIGRTIRLYEKVL